MNTNGTINEHKPASWRMQRRLGIRRGRSPNIARSRRLSCRTGRPCAPLIVRPFGAAWTCAMGRPGAGHPMSVEQKVEMFRLLVELGLRRSRVRFGASQIEFDFSPPGGGRLDPRRRDGASVGAGDHLIRRTFEALQGVRRALCISTIRLPNCSGASSLTPVGRR
ncbi:MAG: hypothetical protein R2911_38135 [Caldilineaceae bacterium]